MQHLIHHHDNSSSTIFRQALNAMHHYGQHLFVLILLAGDIETNPGPRPPRFPCGVCSKACSSYRGAKASILCESCDLWFHAECVGLSDNVFNVLGRSDTPWECYKCGMPNMSSNLFDSIILDSSSSSTSYDSVSSSTSSVSSCHLGSPLAKSSPSKQGKQSFLQNIRALEINFQSIYSKR